eukprot:XP_024998565.1 dematin-like [Gallus gallus]
MYGNGQRGRMDRGNSLPSMLEQKIYPYEMLMVTNRGRVKLPPAWTGPGWSGTSPGRISCGCSKCPRGVRQAGAVEAQ